MKTLEDWLASTSSSSSSEEEESSSSSLLSSASQTPMQKMQKVKTFHNNVESTSEQKVAQEENPTILEPALEKDKSTDLLTYLKQNNAVSSITEKQSTVDVHDADLANKKINSSLTPPVDGTKYERVEVMVVDRGTQTVTTTSTQTDEPYFASRCPQCNHTACVPSANLYTPVATTLLHNRLQRDVNYVDGQYPTGIDGRPYRQLFDRFAQEQHKEASELLRQLEVIQNSVDMLISRYNLPPPPPPAELSTTNNVTSMQELRIHCNSTNTFANEKANSSVNANREHFASESPTEISKNESTIEN